MKSKRLIVFVIAGISIILIPFLITGELTLTYSVLEPLYSNSYYIRAATSTIGILVILKGFSDYLK